MTFLPFIIEDTIGFLLLFVILTNVVFPPFFGVPFFWMFTRKGRDAVDKRYGYIVGRLYNAEGQRIKPTKNRKTQNAK